MDLGSGGGGGYKGGDDASQTSLATSVNLTTGGIFGSGFPQPPQSNTLIVIAVGLAGAALLTALLLHVRKA